MVNLVVSFLLGILEKSACAARAKSLKFFSTVSCIMLVHSKSSNELTFENFSQVDMCYTYYTSDEIANVSSRIVLHCKSSGDLDFIFRRRFL